MKTIILFNKNVIDKTSIISFIKEKKQTGKFDPIRTTTKITEETTNKIITKIQENLKLDNPNIAWILVTGIMQRGGSNNQALNQVQFEYDGTILSAADLNKIIRSIDKKITPRQFARTNATLIAECAIELEIPGDLHAQMCLEYPDLSEVEKAWCSNFQTQNSDCPETVRMWLVENYYKRFKK